MHFVGVERLDIGGPLPSHLVAHHLCLDLLEVVVLTMVDIDSPTASICLSILEMIVVSHCARVVSLSHVSHGDPREARIDLIHAGEECRVKVAFF